MNPVTEMFTPACDDNGVRDEDEELEWFTDVCEEDMSEWTYCPYCSGKIQCVVDGVEVDHR